MKRILAILLFQLIYSLNFWMTPMPSNQLSAQPNQGYKYNLAGERIGVIQGTTPSLSRTSNYSHTVSSKPSNGYSSFKEVALEAPYIYGKVTDTNGQAVPNIEIYEANSGKRVSLNGSSYFNMTIPSERHVYVYIKYEGKTIDDRQMWLKNGELREVNVIVPPYLLQKEEPVFVLNKPIPKPKVKPKPKAKPKPIVKSLPKVIIPPKPVRTKPIMPPPSKWPRAKTKPNPKSKPKAKPKRKPKPKPKPKPVVKPKPKPKPKPIVVPKPEPQPEILVVKPPPPPPPTPSKMTFYTEEVTVLYPSNFDGQLLERQGQGDEMIAKTLAKKPVQYDIQQLIIDQMRATLKKRAFKKWKKEKQKEGWFFKL